MSSEYADKQAQQWPLSGRAYDWLTWTGSGPPRCEQQVLAATKTVWLDQADHREGWLSLLPVETGILIELCSAYYDTVTRRLRPPQLRTWWGPTMTHTDFPLQLDSHKRFLFVPSGCSGRHCDALVCELRHKPFQVDLAAPAQLRRCLSFLSCIPFVTATGPLVEGTVSPIDHNDR